MLFLMHAFNALKVFFTAYAIRVPLSHIPKPVYYIKCLLTEHARKPINQIMYTRLAKTDCCSSYTHMQNSSSKASFSITENLFEDGIFCEVISINVHVYKMMLEHTQWEENQGVMEESCWYSRHSKQEQTVQMKHLADSLQDISP